MSTTVHYSGVGESIIIDGDTFYTFYGKDFNPNVPSFPSSWSTATTSGETSYNLSGFQVGNEVCAGLFVFDNNSLNNSVYISWDMEFQLYVGGSWYFPSDGWSDSRGAEASPNSWYAYYYYAGIDSDEIRPGTTQYRFHIEWSSDDGSSGTINIPFSVSNLSFDTSLHDSGYFWVEGDNLCYTDGTRGNSGYKHKINYDTGYNGGSGDPGYVWIPSANDNHIYYTASNGTVRRTHVSSQWYGGNYAPSGAKHGNIWVSDGNYEDGYGYLCYVNNVGELRRMGNGAPS